MLGGTRLGGQRLIGTPAEGGVKFKGLQVQRYPGQTVSEFYRQWPWDARIKWQVDAAAARGANGLKFYSCVHPVLNGVISQAEQNAKVRQFLDYSATRGLMVYWTLFDGFTDPPLPNTNGLNSALEVGRILNDYPNVVAIDACNELNLTQGFGVTVDHLAALRPAWKAMSPIPMGLGLSVGSSADLTSSGVAAIAPYCDFMDFHVYWANGDPVASDFAAYRAAPYYKPWIVGECGQKDSAGQTAQVARWNALGVLAQERDCWGCVGYTVSDCASPPDDYGMFDASGVERTYLASAFSGWPGHL